jgi:ankyrin repeat protein
MKFVHHSSQGRTALIIASMFGRVEVVKLLLALPGIDYNHIDIEVERKKMCDLISPIKFA